MSDNEEINDLLLTDFLSGKLSPIETEGLAKRIEADSDLIRRIEKLEISDPLIEALSRREEPSDLPMLPLMDQLLSRIGKKVSSPPLAFDEAFFDPAQTPEEIGRLAHFRLFRQIGQGGMGSVFESQDTALGRRVAIKILHPYLLTHSTAPRRFSREAQAIAGLTDEHIVPIYLVGEHRGVPYLVMPLLAGESLADRLKREKKLSGSEVFRIGQEILQGLASAHASGIIHRDIKPANIWLQAGSQKVKLIDFGLARFDLPEEGLSKQGTVIGTPWYMSPEQAKGETVDERTDLFSTGCVLYECATGELPFPGKTPIAVLESLAVQQPAYPEKLNSEINSQLSHFILRLLEKDRNKRTPNALQALSDLQLARTGKPNTNRLVQILRMSFGTIAVCVIAGLVFYPSSNKFLTTEPPSKEELPRQDPGPFVGLPELSKGKVPLDELQRDKIPDLELANAGVGNPSNAPKELVAVIGDSRFWHGRGLTGLAWNQAGDRLYTWSSDGSLNAWLAPEGRKLWCCIPASHLRQNAFFRGTIAISKLGDRLFLGNNRNEILKINERNGEVLETIAHPEPEVRELALSGDGKRLFVRSNSNSFRIYDIPSQSWLIRVPIAESIMECFFSSDGKKLYATDWQGGPIYIWDAERGSELPPLELEEGGRETARTFSPDGNRIFALHPEAKTARVHDRQTGKILRTVDKGPTSVNHLKLSQSAKMAAVFGPNKFLAYDIETNKVLATMVFPWSTITQVAWHPNKPLMAVSGDAFLHIFNFGTLEELPTDHVIWNRTVSISREGLELAAASWNIPRGDPIRISSVLNLELITERFGHPGLVYQADFSPLGDMIASVGAPRDGNPKVPGELILWRREDVSAKIIDVGTRYAIQCCWSLDGNMVAVGCGDKTARLYSRDGSLRTKLEGHSDEVLATAFHPAGKLMATVSPGFEVILWDLPSGKRLKTLPIKAEKWFRDGLQFSPDGSVLACLKDKEVYRWRIQTDTLGNWKTAEPIEPIRGHQWLISALRYHPFQNLLATTSYDGSIRFWDDAGRNVRTIPISIPPNPNNFHCMTRWSAEGRHLLVRQFNGTIHIYRIESLAP